MTEMETPTPPDRILFLIDHFKDPHAGTEAQLHRLVTELTNRGTQCHLSVLKSSQYLERGNFPCPWSALGHTSLGAPATWRAMRKLGRQKAAEGFQLAHTFFNDASVIAPPMLALSSIRTLISRRDMGFWYNRRNLTLLRLTNRWVSACVANSHSVAEITAREERIPKDKLHVIYNGLPDTAPSDFPVPELAALRERGRILAGLVANIRPIKRMHDLIDALGHLQADAPALDVVIIGSGDANALRKRAADLGVAERVHFLGQRSDVAACLRYFDMGVLCSESEGFSNALIEYMRAGLPSVCTETGGNPEAVQDQLTGLLYPVGDVRMLAARLLELVNQPVMGKAMGEAAQQVAKERFSVRAMANAHCRVYQQVLSAP